MNTASAFERMPVAAMIVDNRGKVLALNEEARRLLTPHSQGAAGHKTCRELCGCQLAESQCPLRKSLTRGEPIYRAEVGMVLGGEKRLMVERVSPFVDLLTGEERAVITLGDATTYLKNFRKFKHDARMDRLTGLYNRSHFDEIFEQAGRVERRRTPSAFLMMDLDGLKQANDRYGHNAGDRLLHHFGRILRKMSRRSDLAGRLGGDEFGLYCANTTKEEADQLAGRIQESVTEWNARYPNHPALQVGIGISSSQEQSPKNLREQADNELYLYKRSRKP